jgi:hypothetical protein
MTKAMLKMSVDAFLDFFPGEVGGLATEQRHTE